MLPMFSDELVNYAVNYLEDRGVEFKIATPIVACNEKGFVVKINDQEQQLEAHDLGVRGSKLMEESFEGVKRGRIVTKQDLTIEGHDDIFVIGDVSFIPVKNVHYQLDKLLCNKVNTLRKALKTS